MARIAIATDAWYPQVNGVVTTLEKTGAELEVLGHEIVYLTPQGYPTISCPTYPSIRMALFPYARLAKTLRAFRPDAVHIATEGPIGLAVRRYCTRQRLAFTSSYHTQFAEYVRMRAPIPIKWSYAYLRRGVRVVLESRRGLIYPCALPAAPRRPIALPRAGGLRSV